jgi:ethanolamine utilization microcompartment shell protein EutS
MAPPLSTLALRALTINQQIAVHLQRIHHGFLPGKQLDHAHATLHSLQEMLCDMQKALDTPPTGFPPAKTYIPLK